MQKPNIHKLMSFGFHVWGFAVTKQSDGDSQRVACLETPPSVGGQSLCGYIKFHICTLITVYLILLKPFYIHKLDNYYPKIPYCPFTCHRIAGLTTPPSGQVCHIHIQKSAHASITLQINQQQLEILVINNVANALETGS